MGNSSASSSDAESGWMRPSGSLADDTLSSTWDSMSSWCPFQSENYIETWKERMIYSLIVSGCTSSSNSKIGWAGPWKCLPLSSMWISMHSWGQLWLENDVESTLLEKTQKKNETSTVIFSHTEKTYWYDLRESPCCMSLIGWWAYAFRPLTQLLQHVMMESERNISEAVCETWSHCTHKREVTYEPTDRCCHAGVHK